MTRKEVPLTMMKKKARLAMTKGKSVILREP